MDKIKHLKSDIKIETSELMQEFLDLKTLDSNIIMKTLEDNIKLRETPIDKRKLVLQ